LIRFKYCTTGPWHKIVCWDDTLQQEFDVLLSTQITGGLNFDKNYIIHSAKIVEGLLYWTDNLNRQRKINIDAGIKLNNPSYVTTEDAYISPISQEVASLLKRPPMLPLTVEKVTQPSIVNNNIKNGAFQFCARYYYKDGETSVLSDYSLLANYNSTGQTYNCIDVTFDFGEYIDQDVQRVDLVVRFGETLNYVVINSWDKSIPSQLTEIENHNNNITALTYRFYNDKTGEALSPAYAVKPFESIPLLSASMEVARNRLFLGNNVIGYDSTITTSLIAAAQEATDGTLTAQWVKIDYNSGASQHYFLDMGSFGFFDADIQPTPPAYPSTYAYADMTFVASGPGSFVSYILSNYSGWVGGVQYPGYTTEVTGGPAVPGLSGDVCFKSGASYQLAINFYDFGGRKNGVITNNNLKVDIPNREYAQLNYVTGINWSLSNSNAINEIPDWAEYYSINITKCLTTRFFVQARVKNITYATKDTAGVYLYNTSTYATTNNGVAIDITSLDSQGMGYVFTEGDLVNVYISTTLYTLSIIAQDGNWIICELQDLGAIGNTASPKTDVLFQIYTPFRPSVSEPYYEVSNIFKVTNAGTVSREYSSLAGTIGGDVTLLTRNNGTDYLTENMSPNDTFYLNWYTDAGRPNFVDNIGQTEERNTIAYSNTFIAGSRQNGFSSFEALNEKTIPIECGSIQKLQSTSKVENQQGIIMLC